MRFKKAAEDMSSAINSFRDCGVSVSELSRLGQMASVLTGVVSGRFKGIRNRAKKREVILQAVLESEQLCLIARNIARLRPASVVREKLRRIAKDSILLEDQDANTPGRDNQFELWLASIAQEAGLRPRLEEPDLIVTVGKMRLAIAAKRVKSIKSMETRFAEAGRQIVASRLPGIIAVETSSCLATKPGIAYAESVEEVISRVQGNWSTFCRTHIERLKSLVDTRYVYGTDVFMNCAIVVPGRLTSSAIVKLWNGLELVPMNGFQFRVLQEFDDCFARGFETPIPFGPGLHTRRA